MSFLLRSALGPLALTVLVALQVIAVPEVSAGRASKVSKSARAHSSTPRQRHKQAPTRRAGGRSVARPLRTLRTIQPTKSPVQARTTLKSALRPTLKRTTRPTRNTRPLRRQANSARKGRPQRRLAKENLKRQGVVKSKAAKLNRLQKSLNAAKAGLEKFKARPGVARSIAFYTRVTARLTRKLDSWQARAPPWLAKTMSGLRTYTLPSLAGYTLSKVKKDTVFLGTYFAGSSIISNIVLPASIAIGMDPVLSGVLNALSTPVTLGVVVLRERHNRRKAGDDISIGETTGVVVKEYRDFAKARRESSSVAARALAGR